MIDVTGHAYRQWRRRADTPGIDPELAWDLGEPIDDLEEWDEGRFHSQSRTILLRRGTAIITVYDADDITATLRQKIAHCRGEKA